MKKIATALMSGKPAGKTGAKVLDQALHRPGYLRGPGAQSIYPVAEKALHLPVGQHLHQFCVHFAGRTPRWAVPSKCNPLGGQRITRSEKRGGHRPQRRAAPSKARPLGGQRITRSEKRGGTIPGHAEVGQQADPRPASSASRSTSLLLALSLPASVTPTRSAAFFLFAVRRKVQLPDC